MGFFRKKADPISARSRALQAEISALESEIQRLSLTLEQTTAAPRLRSTTLSGGQRVETPPTPREPVFEEVEPPRAAPAEAAGTRAHFNELGVRKYDLIGAWRRLTNHVHGPPLNNPKLVSYLAAGSIQGLRPLRYERRVARNRVITLCVVLFIVVWGLVVSLWPKH
ncbi:MAG: hypothetical protein HY300_11195 [Verrucomicrobia bacterium]|nr:hypothetical protein [Verrucomicrobiota bacterium]